MLHAREDYQRIQDPANRIGIDEPVLLFRSTDKHFVDVCECYLDLLEHDPPSDPAIMLAVRKQIDRAKKWQALNPEKVKTPDMHPDHVVERDKLIR